MASDIGIELGRAAAAAAKRAAASVVRIDGGARYSASGVVWSADGVVVTAGHGLHGADEVALGLPDGSAARGEVAGRDPATDLAVVRTGASGLAPAAWAEGEPEVGELVLAVTRPGRGPRAGLGVVARTGGAWRTAGGGPVDRYVELDVALQPGFSGGLAADLAGRGVGLTSAGLVRGTALAVPPPTLRRVVEAILAHGEVRRGYLGLASLPVRLPPRAAALAGQETALLVTAVEEESPAGRAGLGLGDLLLALGGAPLADLSDLWPALEEARIGSAVRARFVRGGAVQEAELVVGVRERARGARP
ncbi:S1C family serine protease [Anaeromyxobacter diazotrophicus]|nr:S1C family serine protease [Anaeromyxobacter diazotrophicus]